MRKKLAAGTWKMNGLAASLSEVEALIAAHPNPACDVLLCPPATLVSAMAATAAGRISVGGQDCHMELTGAHTGDISAQMLADAGASHVIVGHSERRAEHGESIMCCPRAIWRCAARAPSGPRPRRRWRAQPQPPRAMLLSGWIFRCPEAHFQGLS